MVRKIKKGIRMLSGKGSFDRDIVLFGCTMWTKEIVDALTARRHTISFIIDNNPEKIGGKCLGYDVCHPSVVKELKGDVLIIVCSGYWMEMESQLKDFGLEKNSDFFTIDIKLSDGYFADIRKLYGVRKGYSKYRKYYDKLSGNNKIIFICPWAASGDIFMAGLFLKSYIEKNEIDDYCVLVLGTMASKVAKLFEWKNVICIEEQDKEDILAAWMLLGTEVMKLKVLLYWGWRVKRFPQPDNPMKLTFMDIMKHDVFELSDTVKPQLPQIARTDYAEKLFDSMGLKQGKTVIIAPYAGSYRSGISMEYWEELTRWLIDRDFTVCTNSAGDYEPVINGTKAIFFPFSEAVNTVEYAGYFIAVRSGLCDIVSYSRCKKIILYESMLNAVSIDYFSLKRMGLSDDAVEFEYDVGDVSSLFEKIRDELT